MIKPLRIAIVTNIPTPYRRPVYEILASMPDISLKVIYCSQREPDREWDLTSNAYEAEYLNERFYTIGDKFIHANPEVYAVLRKFKPNVIIGTGFNPTHLLAFFYSAVYRCAFVPMTDGTFDSEKKLSSVHHFIRRFIYKRSRAFIAASNGGFDLYSSYDIATEKMFKSHLCTNNAVFDREPEQQEKFDLIFSGRFSEMKNPLFALEVAKLSAIKLGRKLSLAFLGAGLMEEEMRNRALMYKDIIDTHFLGFAKQTELPTQYKKCKILLFPTLADVWGVVANEALAAGLPVIISPFSGCASELIRHGENGYICPLDADLWSNSVINLLNDTELYQKMSNFGKELVSHYNYVNAAKGIEQASRLAAINKY